MPEPVATAAGLRIPAGSARSDRRRLISEAAPAQAESFIRRRSTRGIFLPVEEDSEPEPRRTVSVEPAVLLGGDGTECSGWRAMVDGVAFLVGLVGDRLVVQGVDLQAEAVALGLGSPPSGVYSVLRALSAAAEAGEIRDGDHLKFLIGAAGFGGDSVATETTVRPLLRVLAAAASARTRSAVARNPAAPLESLRALAADGDPAVIGGLLCNRTFPAEDRSGLGFHPVPAVRRQAMDHAIRHRWPGWREVYRVLADDSDAGISALARARMKSECDASYGRGCIGLADCFCVRRRSRSQGASTGASATA